MNNYESRREEWKKRRYAPYFTVPTPGAFEFTHISLEDQLSHRFSVEFRLSIIDEVRMAMVEAMEPPLSPMIDGENDPETQEDHDRVRRIHALLGVGPRLCVGLGFMLEVLVKCAGYAASALTLLYWATRQTSTGISRSGLSFAIGGGLLRLFTGTWDSYRESLRPVMFWFAIGSTMLFPALLQLRMVLPLAFERESIPGRPTVYHIRKVHPTARERRSARLSLSWKQLVALSFGLACASYAMYSNPVLLLAPSHEHHVLLNYNTVFPGTYASSRWYSELWYRHEHWSDWVLQRVRLLPLSQALVTAGQLAQICMNYRSGTFAGNYALACYLNAVTLLRLIIPFIARDVYYDGVYLSATAQAALVLAVAWQAFRYPRVEQEIEGEQMDL